MDIENHGMKLLFYNFPLFWGQLLLGSTICSLLPSNIHFKNMIICMILERLRSKNFKKKILVAIWGMGGGGGWY